MSLFLAWALGACSTPQDGSSPAPKTTTPTTPSRSPQTEKSNPLTFDAYIATHSQYDPQDISILFGDDRILTTDDIARLEDGDPKNVRDRFLNPDASLSKNIAAILASSRSDQEKLSCVTFFLKTGALKPGFFDESNPVPIGTPRAAIATDNPVRKLLNWEKYLAPNLQSQTFDYLERVVGTVKALVTPDMPPQQCLSIAWQTLLATTINGQPMTYDEASSQLLSLCLNDHTLDCDMAAYVMLTVAHEMGWPLRLVTAPEHVFMHWEGAGYFDRATFIKNKADLIDAKMASEPLTDTELEGKFRFDIGLQHLQNSETASNAERHRTELDQAISWLTRASELCPKHVTIWYNRGIAHLAAQDYAQAETCFKKSLTLWPDHIGSQHNLGAVYYYQKRYADCRESLNRVIALAESQIAASHDADEKEELAGIVAMARKNLTALPG